MALVERLCQVYEQQEEWKNIALNPFCEALFSVLGGYHTVAEVKAFYSMDAEDQAEMDTLVGRITATPQMIDRAIRVHRVRAILTFWEQGDISTYNTVAGIRQHLNNV